MPLNIWRYVAYFFNHHLVINSAQDTAIVQITIGDVNDNSPQFNAEYYTASLRENSPVGTTIVPVNPPLPPCMSVWSDNVFL
jgi:hypothetical protein